MVGLSLLTPDRDVADLELSQALNADVRTRVYRFLPAIAIAYLLQSLENVGTEGLHLSLLWPVFVTSVCLGGVWMIGRGNAIPDQRVQPLVLGIQQVVAPLDRVPQRVLALR